MTFVVALSRPELLGISFLAFGLNSYVPILATDHSPHKFDWDDCR